MARKKSCIAATSSLLLWRCLPCVVWVGQPSLPAGAPLQMLLPAQQITALGDGRLLSGPHAWSWLALLQSLGLAGAMHMQQPDGGSGSVGSRSTSLSQTLQKALLWQKSSILVRYGRGGCEPCAGTVKNPAEFAVSILLEDILWQRPSPTPLFT